jgi:hypothetical protein
MALPGIKEVQQRGLRKDDDAVTPSSWHRKRIPSASQNAIGEKNLGRPAGSCTRAPTATLRAKVELLTLKAGNITNAKRQTCCSAHVGSQGIALARVPSAPAESNWANWAIISGHAPRIARNRPRPRPRQRRRQVRPAHPLSTVRLVSSQGRPVVLHVRTLVEHLRHRRGVPRLPPPVDFNTVPFMRPLVGSFGVVRGVIGKQMTEISTSAVASQSEASNRDC